MNHLTPWKKEAAEDLENERFGWMEFDRASGSRFLNTDKVEAFLNTLIDRIHAHTLEEVRGKVEGMRAKMWAFGMKDMKMRIPRDEALKEVLELLEYPTD